MHNTSWQTQVSNILTVLMSDTSERYPNKCSELFMSHVSRNRNERRSFRLFTQTTYLHCLELVMLTTSWLPAGYLKLTESPAVTLHEQSWSFKNGSWVVTFDFDGIITIDFDLILVEPSHLILIPFCFDFDNHIFAETTDYTSAME